MEILFLPTECEDYIWGVGTSCMNSIAQLSLVWKKLLLSLDLENIIGLLAGELKALLLARLANIVENLYSIFGTETFICLNI